MENNVLTGDIIAIKHPETGSDYVLRVEYAAKEALVCSDLEGTELIIGRDHEGLTIILGSANRAKFF